MEAAAGLSPRSVSDLERGINRTARKDTAQLLAGALNLTGPLRAAFVAAARGQAPAAEVLAARPGAATGGPAAPGTSAAATRTLSRDIGSFTGRGAELARLLGFPAGAANGGGAELYDHHLLTEPAPGRYLLHGLLREYARALAHNNTDAEDRVAGADEGSGAGAPGARRVQDTLDDHDR